ncbi:DNA replication initiation control protein YabA [Nicoliella spurrieriana]|uniref:DNA replication initiation control protein YabA n=1 Tax=Nicoliella spurrieriana TaxID=2925830 RepID=A0A976RSC3_9LACO|nr:DNA replication initiation control protein YabA [Nicoliella spurrieriana]UQS86997.1 DNA replication initiation control protein YabA [Nicoliella spurrieriana]
MNNKELYNGLKNMESQTKLMVARFSDLREAMNEVLEKNSELEIENQHLRELLESQTKEAHGQKAPAQKAHKRNDSRKTLEKLFDSGFHVCNQFYGKPRENGEVCMFCDEIINRKLES